MILACYIIYYTAHFKPDAICVKCMLKSIILHNSVGVKLHDSTKQSQKIVSYDIILCKIDGKERGACLIWLR